MWCSPYAYPSPAGVLPARNLVERFFGRIKHFRSAATRHDRRAELAPAAIKLITIRVRAMRHESTP